MRLARLATVAALVAGATLVSTLAPPAGAQQPWHRYASHTRLALTTKLPYRPQGSAWSYQPAPRGFTPVFTENVSRHGARTLTDSSDGDSVLALWKVAKADGDLTRRGAGLGPEVTALLAANAKVGYGLLTQSGKDEMETTAARMERRLPSLFRSAASGSTSGSAPRIEVTSASQARTVESANAFVAGLESVDPALASTVAPLQTNDNLLYFHKAAANADYQNYVKNDPRVQAAEAQALALPQTDAAARAILEQSFTPAFVDEIADGEHSAQFAGVEDAAEAIYSLWAVTADLPDEGDWHMGKYLTRQGEDWFGYLDDVTSFYENGPGFSGDTITYKMAGILLNDMFGALNAKKQGTSPLVADLRFTHAEEMFPLATLLGLPGSTKQLPAGTLFSYANDPFRGASVAPMAANVQWDLFRHGSTYLVRMLYNEKQTAFKPSCAPIRPGSYFYDLNTLESCYGYPLAS